MRIVKGTCPSCHKFTMNVILDDKNVKCPLCRTSSKGIKWYEAQLRREHK